MDNHKGGYDCVFEGGSPKAIQSECPVCLSVLRQPHQVTCCGYAFCKACIQPNNKQCPCCKAKTFDIFEDKRLQRLLHELKVHCTNKNEGCEWVGELGQLENHLNNNPSQENQLEGCQFTHIECVYCSKLLKRSLIRIHQLDHCPRRPFQCEHCKDYTSYYEDVTTNHWPECGCYPVPCPNKCGKSLQRQTLQGHIGNNCSLALINCDFEHVGCEVSLPRKDMPTHLNDSVVLHLSLQAASYRQFVIRQKKEHRQLKEKIEKVKEDSNTMKLQLQQLTQAVPICTRICPLEIQFTNFEEYKRNDKKWYSEPFYTHFKGYKMCLKVDANGNGTGKGTHMSVSISIMKGQFDYDLKWPFEGNIPVQLLNQEDRSRDHIYCEHTIHFCHNTPREINGRVIKEQAQPLGWGYPEFISHSLINQMCVKDNSIKFYVQSVKLPFYHICPNV